MTDTRFCRICWNTQRWRKPTGDAAKLEAKGSYVADHGFGHEEWLFNLGWMIGDYRYGFLQPFGKLNSAHSNVIDVILYTLDFNKDRLFVGRIKQCKLL